MQGRIWLLTIRESDWTPILPDGVVYVRGQLERGDGGFMHYQVVAYFGRPVRLSAVKKTFCNSVHAELSRSSAADEYVWKEETRVGEPFEFGVRPKKRNSRRDWEEIKQKAMAGNLADIEADVFIRHYSSLRKIASDFQKCFPMEREIYVYWGQTGTGKSRRAWSEAGMDSYPKDPLTKFWDGYKNQRHVIIDEFRGVINISHVLRWFDRYPVSVEIKGSSVPLVAEKIWITSNLHPKDWYPDLDIKTYDALLRRIKIEEI